ncbi:MAG: IS481 family transposase [Galactobacter sp.]
MPHTTHANAPLTPIGRRMMVLEVLDRGRPVAHVASEFRVARATVTTWVTRYRAEGEDGLLDRPSRPHTSPDAVDAATVSRIEALRRSLKWSARRIHNHVQAGGMDPLPDEHPLPNNVSHVPVAVCLRTVGRWLYRLGISRLRDILPTGEDARDNGQETTKPGVIATTRPGERINLDVKKVGKLPDGGGWRAHGRGSQQHRASQRRARLGYTYIHSAIDAHTRLAYTENLEDEKAITAIGFLSRAMVFFAAHGITKVTTIVTDNGACYKAKAFRRAVGNHAKRHQRIKAYTPKHNGKIERFNRHLVDEVLYAKAYTSEEQRRTAILVWVNHYNYHRPHTACGNKPPAATTPRRVQNVTPSYS